MAAGLFGKIMKINIKDVHLIVYDFDGVMTDNKVLLFEDGKEAVFCNRADGLAISKIRKMGIPQIILSTEKNQVVKFRAKKLKIPVLQNINDKKRTLVAYCEKNNYDLEKVVFIGNDTNDLESMKIAGISMAPYDADERVKEVAKIIIKKNGGEGVIREFYRKFVES